MCSLQMTYPRAPGGGGGERRGPFGRPDEDYGRGGGGGSGGGGGRGGGAGGYEYEGAPRYFPNGGGPRSYHAEEQRGYHGDGRGNPHFPAERRAGPPARRVSYDFFYWLYFYFICVRGVFTAPPGSALSHYKNLFGRAVWEKTRITRPPYITRPISEVMVWNLCSISIVSSLILDIFVVFGGKG